jgi:hypothetical protein
MGIHCRMTWLNDIQQVIYNNAKCYYHTLANFKSIDAGKDIDCVGAENTQERHIRVIEPPFH